MSSLRKSLFNRIDGVILLLYALLVVVGILAIFSVEHRTTSNLYNDYSYKSQNTKVKNDTCYLHIHNHRSYTSS